MYKYFKIFGEEKVRIMKKLTGVLAFFLLMNCSSLNVCFSEETPVVIEKNDDVEVEKVLEKLPVTKIALALFYIKFYYYKEVDIDKCLEQVLENGISACTDKYSRFINEKGVEAEDSDSRGFYDGVGIKYDIKAGTASIVHVYPNSPAGKLGMRVGDVVIAISPTGLETDLVAVAGFDWDKIAELLDGKSNKLIISIRRNGKPMTFRIEKGAVKEDSVFLTKFGTDVGYVKITSFIETTANDFELAVSSLNINGSKALIIDLRNNLGGLLGSVVDIVGFFQSNNDPIVYTQSRGEEYKSIVSRSKKRGIFRNQKVVVLVNEKSASASEVMSGWLKEEKEAVVIGQPTFGKDLVQSLFDFPDGSRLHLTTSQYFIGIRKVSVGKVGVEPTIKVKASDDPKDKTDYQLQKAISIAHNKAVCNF